MSDYIWIDAGALLMLHEQSLVRFGGKSGMRDRGLYESALARPENLFAYKPDADLAELAAAYAYGLAKNHAFVDGNKRVAFLSVGVFLGLNGYRLEAPQVGAIQAVLGLASGEISEEAFARWIRDHIKKR